jgi:hypothetical protein
MNIGYRQEIFRASLFAGLLAVGTTAVSEEKREFWIGPDQACDYTSIQQALAEGAGSQAHDELRLSLQYRHSGMARLPTGLDIRGGFSACKGAASGTHTALYAPARQSLFVIEPAEEGTSSVFTDLRLVGDNFGPKQGGVIHMERGASILILDNVVIQNGSANEGGALFMAGGANHLELRNTQLAANEAVLGGGIYCKGGSTVALQSGRIEDNTAQLAGGGVLARAGCRVVADPDRIARIVVGNRVQEQEIAGLDY